jgi:hypothetical protein
MRGCECWDDLAASIEGSSRGLANAMYDFYMGISTEATSGSQQDARGETRPETTGAPPAGSFVILILESYGPDRAGWVHDRCCSSCAAMAHVRGAAWQQYPSPRCTYSGQLSFLAVRYESDLSAALGWMVTEIPSTPDAKRPAAMATRRGGATARGRGRHGRR